MTGFAPVTVARLQDNTTVGVCCQPAGVHLPGIPIFPTDIACGHVTARCTRCGQPLCTPAQTAEALAWAEQYG
jgi:hypothetical protein